MGIGVQPCCCGGCGPFTDTFAGAASTNLGGDWDELAGDWKKSGSDTLTLDPVTTEAFVVWRDPFSGCTFPTIQGLRVTVEMKAASGCKVRLHLGEDDWFELTPGASATLKSYATGVEATATVTAAADTWHTIEVRTCFTDTLFNSVVYFNDALVMTGGWVTGDFGLGLGTGDTVSGTPEFRNWEVQVFGGTCGGEECPECEDDDCGVPLPAEVDVVLDGYDGTHEELDCTLCANLDGSYTLTETDDDDCELSSMSTVSAPFRCKCYRITGLSVQVCDESDFGFGVINATEAQLLFSQDGNFREIRLSFLYDVDGQTLDFVTASVPWFSLVDPLELTHSASTGTDCGNGFDPLPTATIHFV